MDMTSSLRGPGEVRRESFTELSDELFTSEIYFSSQKVVEQGEDGKTVEKIRRPSVLKYDESSDTLVRTDRPTRTIFGREYNKIVDTDWVSHASQINAWMSRNQNQLLVRVARLAGNDTKKQFQYLNNFHGNCNRLLIRHIESLEKNVMKGNKEMISEFKKILGLGDLCQEDVLEAVRASLTSQDPKYFSDLVSAINKYKNERVEAVSLLPVEKLEVQYRIAEANFLKMKSPVLILSEKIETLERSINDKNYNPDALIDMIKSIEDLIEKEYTALTDLPIDKDLPERHEIRLGNRVRASELLSQIRGLVKILTLDKKEDSDSLVQAFCSQVRGTLIDLRGKMSTMFVNGPLPHKRS